MKHINTQKEQVAHRFEIPVMDVLKHFPIYGDKQTMFDLLEQYETFRKTIDMPGDIVVVGRNIAVPLLNAANFSEAQTIGDRTRLIFAFEEFEKTDEFEDEKEYLSLRDKAMALYDMDRFVGWKARIKLEKGSLPGLLEDFVKKHIGLRANLILICNLSLKESDRVETILSNHRIKNGVCLNVHCETSGTPEFA